MPISNRFQKLGSRSGKAAVAVLALATLGTGAAFASVSVSSTGMIHGCFKKTTGDLRVVAAGELCKANETSLTWAQQGPKGDKGDKGDRGADGLSGRDGVNGANGRDGRDGRDGIDGAPGAKGDKGDKGDRGDDGLNGRDGVDGANGRDGLNGANGRDGIDGAPGAKGDKGDKGDRGDNGLHGRDGVDGTNGRDGANGRDGTNGAPGAKGDKGDKGDQGIQGVPGIINFTTVIDGDLGDTTGTFVSKGNTLVLTAGGTAYRNCTATPTFGLVRMSVLVDGVKVAELRFQTNVSCQHVNLVPVRKALTGIPAGVHTVQLVPVDFNTSSDAFDLYNVSVEELAY